MVWRRCWFAVYNEKTPTKNGSFVGVLFALFACLGGEQDAVVVQALARSLAELLQ